MSPGSHGAATRHRKHLRVLLPFTRDSLRIPDELAREIGSEDALIIVPQGRGVVQRVEVGRDGDGAFLGRGWPEFAGACGVGAGWFVVLRHHGGGVLTVKAFDATHCLRELGTPPGVEAAMGSTESSRRPQFISLLPADSMEKMIIPAKIVQNYIPRGQQNNHIAVLFGPLGKMCEIEVNMNQSGMFFAGGWSQFLAHHGITETNCLLLRHDGNMMFTAKVFEPNGCQRESKHKDTKVQKLSTLQDKEKQQEVSCGEEQERLVRYQASMQKCKINNNWPSSERQKKPKASLNCCNEASFQKTSFYEIGPPSWIKIVIDARIHGYDLPLATAFCDAIGLWERSMIMLKTSMDSPGLWKVQGRPGTNCSYMLVQGWRFFQENSLKEGDMCTFNVVETTLWHVVITRCKEMMYQFNYQETPSASSMERKRDNDISSSVEQKDPNSPIVLKGSSKRRCVFEIGQPAWIKKEINIHTIENVISLPLSFCKAIGLRETCVVTLRTSVSSNTIWQARVIPYKHCNHLGGSGWKRFCWENRIKEGDVCTFNVVETKLWHVVITRHEEKQETPKSKKYRVSSEGQKRSQVPMISRKHSVFHIGPPAWMKKEINTSTMKSHLSLPLSFCEALGLRECCTVTLMTSTSSTSSWQVQHVPYLKRNQLHGSGWKRFCYENGIKVGDICTFQIVEATLWHVTIARR